VRLFDVFRSDALGPGKVSLAFALQFRAADRTLTDAEVGELREQVPRRAARRGHSPSLDVPLGLCEQRTGRREWCARQKLYFAVRPTVRGRAISSRVVSPKNP